MFVHVLPLLNALVMGESAEMALRASLFSTELLRQSAVVYTFRDDQNVLQVRYVFLVVTNYHPHPLGLRLLCPTCRSSLLGKNKRNARENYRWRFKCETCMKQTAWLTPEGHHFVGPSDSTYFYREYPAPDTYSKLIHGATWNIIDSSA